MNKKIFPLDWSVIFATYSLLPVNVLMFLSPAAIAVGLSSGTNLSTAPGANVIIIASCLLGFSVPLWLIGMVLAVVMGPNEIRDHKNLEIYLERANKSNAVPENWPTIYVKKIKAWEYDDIHYNRISKIIVSVLVWGSILNCVCNYLLFLGLSLRALLH